ncbi:MAG TPA: hypothetical protein VKZ55_07840 [Microthrixaceae bacterium]|nr:hypothetical protein [Microthrixaceae bacterium]
MSDPNLPPPPGTPPPPGGGFPPPPPGGGAPPPPPPPGGFGGPPGGFGGPPGGGGGFGGPPPAQPYGGGDMPQLEVGAAISYGWKKFQEHAKDFIVLVLVVFAVTVVLALLSQFALLPAFTGSDSGFVVSMFGFALVTVIQFVIGFIVQAGVYRAALGVTRGQAPTVSQLTDTTNLGPFVLTVLLVGVGAFVGYLLCFIPGLIWIVLTAYAPIIAIDRGTSPVDSIRQSIDWVTNNLGQVLLILIVAYVVYIAGAIACFVGLLVSIPVALVAITYSYRALNNETVVP